jgi:hypothetical protein
MSYQLATALADGSPVPVISVAGKLYALREVRRRIRRYPSDESLANFRWLERVAAKVVEVG